MEQALGHVTHHQNLARWVAEDGDICPTWLAITQEGTDLWEKVPGIRSNWSLKASLRARSQVSRLMTQGVPDALFWHTQTTALFSSRFACQTPGIVSLDATPINYDSVGAAYGHVPARSGWLEQKKHRWHSATFQSAAALVTWCQWAADSLVTDYGVSRDKIEVIPPGVEIERWRRPSRDHSDGPLKMLFVGGDFGRKGGHELVEAFTHGLARWGTLDIATRDEGAATKYAGIERLTIHCGLQANSPMLRKLYADADMFLFPTQADCLPIAVMEAMAAGLPVITTRVGALCEEVEDGRNGLLVPVNDVGALVAAASRLATDPVLRQAMAAESERMACERFDARRNYGRIIALMKRTADIHKAVHRAQ